MAVARTRSRKTIVLVPVLDTRAASGLRDLLLPHIRTNVMLDASMVTTLGGQSLQVLLAARSSCAQAGKTLTITTPSAEFLAALQLLDATKLLNNASKVV